MATLRTIRLRIKGTKNIKQITRAMEAVSAVKMRKSQGVALAARPFATAALHLLKNVHRGAPGEVALLSPLLEKRPVVKTLVLVITSDKGLAGPFNTNVLKRAEQVIREIKGEVAIAAVGKKAADYFSRRGRAPIASWTGFGDYAELSEVEPLFDVVLDAFISRQFDVVITVYTNFLSAMKQEVAVRKLLPFSEEGLEEMIKGIVPERGRFSESASAPLQRGGGESSSRRGEESAEYLFEPSPKRIFESLLPSLLKIQIYHAVLEANASEHSSRMVAMRNATDNASDLIKSYTVSLNKARQAVINKELAEITGGSEALSA